MDKVTAAMVLTSLSTSPLVRSPPVKVSGKCTVMLCYTLCSSAQSFYYSSLRDNSAVWFWFSSFLFFALT